MCNAAVMLETVAAYRSCKARLAITRRIGVEGKSWNAGYWQLGPRQVRGDDLFFFRLDLGIKAMATRQV